MIPIRTLKKHGRFDIFQTIIDSVSSNEQSLRDGDIIAISSKFVSHSQDRILELDSIVSSMHGKNISKRFRLEPNFAEAVIRESDKVFGGIAGFVIASSDNIMAPNAGIDKSNIRKGKIILYPNNPYLLAEQLRRKIFLNFLIHVGIIIIDSRLMPTRVGTTGVAISCAGIEPVLDMRAKKDLEGNPLKVTYQSVVDNFASIANYKMGESAESTPIVIIRGSGARLTDRKIKPSEIAVPTDQCVYVRALSSS